ncbi:LysR family transcriptional regulator (plasmid) [Vibrio cyclitrophicus]|uniref:LysR family transcriptional regulator n=2 Tax=Vibrio TaxID=662 RepID=UPI000CABE055|nr:LysR family transcriptional regulator [Vibrio cyclitrophicus]PMJ48849.1 hypothetical protein BCU22_19315 [Vibrio cyclitrophicus]
MSKLAKNLMVFNEVYNQPSFREVTKSLGVSLATISRSIAELESDCRMKLFIKVGGKYEPTRAAERLHESISYYNQGVNRKYELFKRYSSFLTLHLPHQVSGDSFVQLMTKYNIEFDTALCIFEGANYTSREAVYTDMSNGKLDLFIDMVEHNSSSFISTLIKNTDLYLIGSRKYYESIDENTVTEKSKFVKMSWLGSEGQLIEDIFGIESGSQTGYVTQNVNSYYKVISATDFLGVCSEDAIENLAMTGEYTIGTVPIYTVSMYLIMTKAAWYHKDILQWIISNIESKHITFALPNFQIP